MMRLSLIAIVFCLAGCHNLIEIDAPQGDPVITINGFLQPDSLAYLLVSESRGILSLTPHRRVKDARIEFFEDDKSLGFFEHVNNGWYRMNKKPEAGKKYAITVETTRQQRAEAETVIPGKIEITGALVTNQVIVRDLDEYRGIDIRFDDPADEDNYYEIVLVAKLYEKVFRNDSVLLEHSYTVPLTIAPADPVMIEKSSFGPSLSLLLDDRKLQGKGTFQLYVLRKQLEKLALGEKSFIDTANKTRKIRNDSLFITLNHIHPAYYHYRSTLDLQNLNSYNPFAEPVYVYGNIANGYGIFTGYNTSSYLIDLNSR